VTAPFRPTHRTAPTGMDTWPRPDANAARGPRIGEPLDVELLEQSGDWAKVAFSNGWTAWVDGRLLVPLRGRPATAPGAGVARRGAPGFDMSALMADRPRAFALGGALLVALSSFLPWLRGTGASVNSFDITAEALIDYKTTSTGGIKIGMLLLAVAAGLVFVLVRGADARIERALGIAAVAVPVVYLVQLQRAVSDAQGVSLTDIAGIGILGAAAGGALVLLAPTLAARSG
jgi:hypothetical protein